jgi:hypothetical protein
VSKRLDPPMPWGDDDLLGIRWIRVSCFVVTTTFVALMYALGVYSKLYYVLIQINASVKELPESTYIYLGVLLFLIITGTITGIVAKFHDAANEQHTESIIPRQINRVVWMIPTTGIVLLIIEVLCENFLQMFNSWLVFPLVLSIVFTITPALVIYREDQLKSYATRLLKNKMEEAFLLSIYVTPAMVTVIMNFTLYIIYELLDV